MKTKLIAAILAVLMIGSLCEPAFAHGWDFSVDPLGFGAEQNAVATSESRLEPAESAAETTDDSKMIPLRTGSGVRIGDMNGDNEVTAADGLILARFLAGWDGYEAKIKDLDAAALIDSIPGVDARDRMILARYVAGDDSYEKWFFESEQYYTITFDPNGDGVENMPEPQRVKAGECAVEPEEPFMNGYFFCGWAEEASGEGLFDFEKPLMGNAVLKAIWLSKEDGVTGEGSYVDIFSVTDLTISEEGNNISAIVSAQEECIFKVRFIEEEDYFSPEYEVNGYYITPDSLYAEAVVPAQTDMKTIFATLVGTLPEYYVAEGILLDSYGAMLCNPYTSIEHTRRYAEFEAKTIYDFDENEVVLQFGEEIDNDFGVLADDVKIINVQGFTRDDDGSVYTLEGVIDPIAEGDKLFINDGEHTDLIRVGSVLLNGGTAEIVPAKPDSDVYGYGLNDFYKFLKVNKPLENEKTEANEFGKGDEFRAFEQINENEQQLARAGEEIYIESVEDIHIEGETGETEIKLNPYIIKIRDYELEPSVELKGKLSAVIIYDLVLFGKDYFRCDLIIEFTGDIIVDIHKVKSEGSQTTEIESDKPTVEPIKLGKISIPIGVTGFNAAFEPQLMCEWKITSGVKIQDTIEYKAGFTYNTIDGYQKVDSKEHTFTLSANGHLEAKMGFYPGLSVEFLQGVVEASVSSFIGLKAEGDIDLNLYQEGSKVHACTLCLNGELKLVGEIVLSMSYEITKNLKGTPIEITIPLLEKKLFDFAVSIMNPVDCPFGGELQFMKGKCKNYKYKVSFVVNDANNVECNPKIYIHKYSDSKTLEKICETAGGQSIYLYDGKYRLETTIQGAKFVGDFEINGESKKLRITANPVRVNAIIITPVSASLLVGESAALTAKVTPDNATNQSIVWKSNAPEVADVTAAGIITAKKVGTAVITAYAQDESQKTASCTVNVKDYSASVSGTVCRKDDSSTAIQNAKVRICLAGAKEKTVNTNANGFYNIKGLPAGTYDITISKYGYVDEVLSVTVTDTAVVKDATLTPRSFYVIFNPNGGNFATGDPFITKSKVYLKAFTVTPGVDLTPPEGKELLYWSTVATDAGGPHENGKSGHLDYIDGQTYTDVGGDNKFQPVNLYAVWSGEQVPVNYTISGTVTDGTAGLSGVTVELWNSNGMQVGTGSTDDNGTYQFTGCAAGTYTLYFSKDGYTPVDPADGKLTVTLPGNIPNVIMKKDEEPVQIIASGNCGYWEEHPERVTWSLGSDGTLTIAGDGWMQNFDYENGIIPPWDEYRASIHKLKFIGDVTSIGDEAFCNGDWSRDYWTVDQPYQFEGTLTLPDGITYIENSAFEGTTFTGDLIIPDSVTSIGISAFAYCEKFNGKLHLPVNDEFTAIYRDTFHGCSGFTGQLVIPDNVVEIYDSAFHDCSGFTGLTLSKYINKIRYQAFRNLASVTGELTIPVSLTEIMDWCFADCTGLTKLVLPKTIEKIDKWAFSGCTSLQCVDGFHAGITHIGENAFSENTALTDVYFFGDADFKKNPYYGTSYCEWHKTAFAGEEGQFVIHYVSERDGWNSPEWKGPDGYNYQTKTFVPDSDENCLDSGKCGENITWRLNRITDWEYGSLYKNKWCLYVEGDGDMTDFENERDVPWFIYRNSIGTIRLSGNITHIGSYSFKDCTYKEIEDYYVEGETWLTPLIPNSIISIGDYAYAGIRRGDVIVSHYHDELILPDGLTKIGTQAFAGLHFRALKLNRGLETIGSGAFFGTVDAMDEILIIPDSVRYIGSEAFASSRWEYWAYQYGIYFEGDFPTCGTDAPIFGWSIDSEQEAKIYYDPSKNGWDDEINWRHLGDPLSVLPLRIGGDLGPDCKWTLDATKTVTLSGSGEMDNTFIEDSDTWMMTPVLSPYSELVEHLTIEEGITEIGPSLFTNCTNLKGPLVFPSTLTKIAEDAFNYCASLTGNLVIPETVTSIGDRAFSWCSGLTGSLNLPDALVSLGSGAFSDCSGFTGVLTLPSSLQNVGTSAFSGCSGLYGELVFPEGITEIGDYAFYQCSGFNKNLRISDSVETIGACAFYGCGFSDQIVIGKGLQSIGYSAFAECDGICYVYFYGDAPKVDGYQSTFGVRDDTFTVYHLADKSDWPAPGEKWIGYMTAIFEK